MATCMKRPFPNEWAARLAVRKIRRRIEGRGLGLPTGIHWCATCMAWHVTSKRQTGTPWWEKGRRLV